jgi:uncharacterized repeat protein (TIGR02543 family)
MKILRTGLSIFLALVLIFSVLPIKALAETPGDYEYTVSDGKATIIGYSGNATNLIIPAMLGGYPVTVIGDNAFSRCEGLVSVTIPVGVISIRSYAFIHSSNLTRVEISSSVTSISSTAFYSCDGLIQITVNNSNANYSSDDGVLFNKNKTLLIRYPSGDTHITYTIPASVTTIGPYAFSEGLSLKDIAIPDNVTTIGLNAFEDCKSLETVAIGCGVTGIGQHAFANTYALNQIVVNSANANYSSEDGVLFNKNKTLLIKYPESNTRTSYIIPSSVVTIADSSFSGCNNVIQITIPDSVTTVNPYAFCACKNLKSVIIGSNVTTIWEYAFAYCQDLVTAYFYGNAPTLGEQAFDETASGFTVYYLLDRSGWTTPTWKGYNALLWKEEKSPAQQYQDYYSTPASKLFRIIDPTAGYPPVTGFSVAVNGTTYNTGAKGDITIDIPNDYSGNVVISKSGYHTYTMPSSLVGAYNVVTMIKNTDSGYPFVQAVLLDKSSRQYKSFTNLRVERTTIYENSAQLYEVFVEINWKGNNAKRVYLKQGETEIPVNNGTTGNVALGMELKRNGGTVYVVAETSDGKKSSTPIGMDIIEKPIELDIPLGDKINIPIESEIDFLDINSDLKLDIGGLVPVTFKTDQYGKFEGTIGIELTNKDDDYKASLFENVKGFYKKYKDGTIDGDKMFKDTEKLLKSGKFTPPTYGSIAIKTDIQFLGYIEGTFDIATYKWKITEGGIVAKVSGSAKYTQQLATSIGPIYWDAEFKVGLDFGFAMYTDKRTYETIVPPLDLKAKAEITAGLAYGIADYAGLRVVQAKGGLHSDLTIPFSKDNFKLYLEGELLFLSIDLFGQSIGGFKLPPDKPYKFYLYPWGYQEPEDQLKTVELELKQAPREYLESKSVIKTLLSKSGSVSGDVYKSNTYSYSAPQIAVLEDGTSVMVWVDDDAARSKVDRTCLYYSVNTGGTWSLPTAIEQDGTADYSPVLKKVNGKIYLVWADADAAFGTDEQPIDDVTAGMGISYAVYDPASDTFTHVQSITGINNLYDFNPDVTELNGQPAVVWVQNSQNRISGVVGSNSIHSTAYSGSSWVTTQLASNINAVDKIAADGAGDILNVYFSQDGDGDLSDVSDMELYKISNATLSQITNNEVPDAFLSYGKGNIISMKDNQVCMLNASGGNEELITTNISGSDMKYMENTDGKQAILYLASDDEMRQNVWGIFKDGDNWGQPVQLSEGDGYIRSFSAAYNSSGDLIVAANRQTINFETTALEQADLCLYNIDTDASVCVDPSAKYNMYSLTPGSELEMYTDVKNNGFTSLKGLDITVKKASGDIVGTDEYLETILPGETVTIKTTLLLPETLPDAYYIYVTPKENNVDTSENNMATCVLDSSDISVEEIWSEQTPEGCDVIARIVNRGFKSMSNTTVTLRKDTAEGTSLANNTIEAIDPQQAIDVRLSASGAEDGDIFYVTASEQEKENILANNSGFAVYVPLNLQPAEEKTEKIPVSSVSLKDSATLLLGNTLQLNATVLPDNATNPQVTWSSSKPEVATVNQTGKVTAVKEGSTVITAEADGVSDTCTVTVVPSSLQVTFNSQSGSAVAKQTISYNGFVTKPSNPTRTGYTFDGWYKEAACKNIWNFSIDKVIQNITLYAKWIPANEYIISVSATTGGTVTGGKAYMKGATAILRAAANAGYRFVRWTEGGKQVSSSAEYKFTVNNARVLKAEFAIIGIPDSLKATGVSYNSIKLTWTAVAGAVGYDIYRATSKTGVYLKVGNSTAVSFNNTGLTTGTIYYYKVCVKCSALGKETYGKDSAVVSAKPMLGTPTLKAASASYNSVKLTWGAVAGTTKYEVYRSTSKTGKYTKIAETTSGSYVNTKLTTGKNYYYEVRAYRMVGKMKVYGGDSAVVSIKPVPAIPTNVKANRASSTSIRISWKKVTGASKYEVYRSTSKTGKYNKVTETTSGSYVNTKLTKGKVYYYMVRAYRLVGKNQVYGSFSVIVSVKL